MTKPHVSKNRSLPMIWLLPFLAILIASWLIYQDVNSKGVEVTITFNDAKGIAAGSTKVIYKGVKVGLVKNLHITEDMQRVKVTVELNNEIKPNLTEATQFWLVKPKISMTGITGLDTLVAGNYIQIRLGAGEHSQKEFIALTKPPIMKQTATGLYINVLADKLNSIDRGSLIYYREMPVGQVVNYHLTADLKGVIMKLRIDEDYRHLIKPNTRFWNTSGVSIKAGLSGVSIKTGSLATIIAGGIAFYTPESDLKEDQTNNQNGTFKLYSDFDSAQVGISVKIYFQSATGLQADKTEIKYKGFKIGLVKSISHQQKTGNVLAEIMFDPSAKSYLKSETKFWLVKPRFGLSALNGLSSLIEGNYISLIVGKGDSQREFVALDKPPIMLEDKRRLHLILKAEALNSIQQDSPILFKKIPVGRVHEYNLSKDGTHIFINISIDEDYKHLVQADSRFWNVSGVEMKLDSSGVKLRTGTLKSSILGGIAFFNPSTSKKNKVKNNHKFTLHDNYDEATNNGRLLVNNQATGNLTVKLYTEQLGSLDKHSKVYYQKIPVGELTHYELSSDNKTIILTLTIKKAYKKLIKKQTQFWRDSGIKVDANLSGVKIQTPSLKALINGGISFDTPKNIKLRATTEKQRFFLFESQDLAQQKATKIHVQFSVAEGLSEGTAVKYKGIKVGKVTNLKLSKNNQKVDAEILLFDSAQDFARLGTKFWLVGAKVGLFSNQHLETLVKGQYIEIIPAKGEKRRHFIASSKSPTENGLVVQLEAKKLGSIKIGDKIYYRQLPVGRVIDFHLTNLATHIAINIFIEAPYVKLVKQGSKFWNVSGIKVDIGLFSGAKIRAESAETLFVGGIAFATPENSSDALKNSVFTLHQEVEDEWLNWTPMIKIKN